ncbi:MAG: hypothetical protein HYT88_01000 [Candidatus Omnitrophica bacterium]|nr:hypothetical protein [Candidatus Omnitrophota bacterium]
MISLWGVFGWLASEGRAAEELRDPFVFGPRREAAAQEGSLGVISGIIWDESSPLVMINGELVGIGQAVGSWKIIAIGPDTVTLQNSKRKINLASGSSIPTE